MTLTFAAGIVGRAQVETSCLYVYSQRGSNFLLTTVERLSRAIPRGKRGAG